MRELELPPEAWEGDSRLRELAAGVPELPTSPMAVGHVPRQVPPCHLCDLELRWPWGAGAGRGRVQLRRRGGRGDLPPVWGGEGMEVTMGWELPSGRIGRREADLQRIRPRGARHASRRRWGPRVAARPTPEERRPLGLG
jgi:hypothetical protein